MPPPESDVGPAARCVAITAPVVRRALAGLLVGFVWLAGTADAGPTGPADREPSGTGEARLGELRMQMVEEQIAARGIRDEGVLEAMRTVERHRFAPDLEPARAYRDRPWPIGHRQTISQPYIVALMSELADVRAPCKVLEVGTGSGYQAAVLAQMGCQVYTIEILEPLAARAREILTEQGYSERVHVRHGDGYRGWPVRAPFDAIVVTAAAPRIPRPLLEQLRVGGRLVIPVGELGQLLEVHRRTDAGIERREIIPVRFVPMTGEIRKP